MVDQEAVQPSELELLKERADLMGITYHPNIGVEKLKAKINERQNSVDKNSEYGQEEVDTINDAEAVQKASKVPAKAVPTPQQDAAMRRKKALKLVRIRVSCMNSLKGNMEGEIFSCGNAEIGMVKKFVPFNAEDGWHVPQIIVDFIKNKKFMTHYGVKVGNKKIKKNRLVSEYSVEILPPLTSQELDELKQRQAMAQGQ